MPDPARALTREIDKFASDRDWGEKLKKNALKYPVAKARGSARKYNEL